MTDWRIFMGAEHPHDGIERLPAPPSWRRYGYRLSHETEPLHLRGATYQATDEECNLVNAALYLRRPLFITGKPGVGKSSLAYAVAYELKLGPVLHWPITTRVTLKEGLYEYDAVGRLQDASLYSRKSPIPPDIGRYVRLGPLGTALLPSARPRVLLIDEIDKGDVDLPNDLLNVFEEGEFVIPELARIAQQQSEIAVMPYDGRDDGDRAIISSGRVHCEAFPFVVLTSNGEREFPPAFLRRCIRLDVPVPTPERLASIVEAHLGADVAVLAEELIADFVSRRTRGDLATDQLLNAIFMATHSNPDPISRKQVYEAIMRSLSEIDSL